MDDIAKEKARQNYSEVNNIAEKNVTKNQAKQAVNNQQGASQVNNVNNQSDKGAIQKTAPAKNNPAHKDKKCYFCGIMGHVSADCRKKKFEKQNNNPRHVFSEKGNI